MNMRSVRRNLANLVIVSANRLLNRSFAPTPRRTLFIETAQRCNLSCRFCAYETHGASALMDTDTFRGVVEQATRENIETVWLTPMLGDVFADPDCTEKFRILESNPIIRRFGFYTNFILAREKTIRRFPDFQKLHTIFISIYGYDPETFTRVTRKSARQYDKLLVNLKILRDVAKDMRLEGGLHFNMRTIGGTTADNLPDTPLTEALRDLVRERGAHLSVANEFDSWGGTVTAANVAELGIRLIDGRHIYHRGACTLLFSSPQVMADGTVHACACRDVDGSLKLGHISELPLRDILSWRNSRFRRIIEDQEAGLFSSVCRACSMYRSVYDHRSAAQDPSLETVPLAEAIRLLSD